ncbi:MAG: alanine racemase [Nitrospirae bacterium]|nr:alanine racemase [Nitrospirota bacterium]
MKSQFSNLKSPRFFRPTVCTIDLDALGRNFLTLKQLAGPRKFIAVVKSNAYGHGAVEVARRLELQGVNRLAVVSLEEAIELREAGIRKPILILGILQPSSADLIAAYRFTPALFSQEMARALQSAARSLGVHLPIHIKIDSGMGRLGITPAECPAMAETLEDCPNLRVESVFTHLAKADIDPEFTTHQLRTFTTAAELFKGRNGQLPIRHAANSAAVLRHPDALFDAIRPGLALYGVSPFDVGRAAVRLEPILSLSTRILFLKELPADTPISYGGTFRTRRPSVIATLPIGYADGLSRLRSNPSEGMGGKVGGHVLVKGRRAPIVGVLCGISSRVPRIYVGPPGDQSPA